MGHVVRCISLARALRRRGVDVSFAMRELGGTATTLIEASGFHLHSIPCKESPNGSLTDEDLEMTCRIARRSDTSWVLIDHYGASVEYMRSLSERGVQIAVVDDMADRDLRSASWILNQNLEAENLPHLVEPTCTLLFGPKYALLRPQFTETRRTLRREFSSGNHVLLTFGGGDTSGLCVEVIERLEAISPRLTIRCVIAGSEPIPQSLHYAVRMSRHSITILRNVSDMASVMVWADVSINAGGSTCWELCCLGVPMIITVTSRDQAMIASALEKYGCARNVGKWDETEATSKLLATLEELVESPEIREKMSSRAQQLVDGYGCERVAASLCELINPNTNVDGHANN